MQRLEVRGAVRPSLGVKVLKSDKNNGTLHEDQNTFLIVFCSVFLRMGSNSDKISEKTKTHILCSITFVFENRAF